MAQPSKDFIFKTLTTMCHHTTEEQDLFSPTNNDAEYWSYTDLYNLFLHPMFDPDNMFEHAYQTFDTTPSKKLKIAPYELFKNHVVVYQHKYTIHSPHPPYNQITKNGTDIKLSRYACYCIFRNKPNLIFTSTFFMMPNADFKTVYETSYKFARIYQRDKLRESEHNLAGVLKSLDANHSLFQHEMTKTFCNGYTIDYLLDAYHLNPKKALADNMGAISMHARRTAINTAIHKFNFAHTRDLQSFSSILHNELRIARNKMISEYKFPPEKDFHKATIRNIESEYKTLESNFIKQYANKNLTSR